MSRIFQQKLFGGVAFGFVEKFCALHVVKICALKKGAAAKQYEKKKATYDRKKFEETDLYKQLIKTGAKVALATVGVIAILGGGIAATYFGLNAINDHKETTRAESLVVSYMDEDKLV